MAMDRRIPGTKAPKNMRALIDAKAQRLALPAPRVRAA